MPALAAIRGGVAHVSAAKRVIIGRHDDADAVVSEQRDGPVVVAHSVIDDRCREEAMAVLSSRELRFVVVPLELAAILVELEFPWLPPDIGLVNENARKQPERAVHLVKAGV